MVSLLEDKQSMGREDYDVPFCFIFPKWMTEYPIRLPQAIVTISKSFFAT